MSDFVWVLNHSQKKSVIALLRATEMPYKVTVSRGGSRSNRQNQYLWGVVYPTIIRDGGEAMRGWENKDLHEYFLGQHFGWRHYDLFGMKKQKPERRSSILSTTEFSEFVDFIQRAMAEIGIFIPDPEEQ